MMKPIQLLFPMGGLGTRFAESPNPRFRDSATGKPIPKPLIKVDGQLMILKAISSFARLMQQGVPVVCIFIIRVQHEEEYQLATTLKKAIPSCKIVLLDHDTKGAVETCLVAEPDIDVTAPLVICDCDLYFSSKAYEEVLLQIVHALSSDEKKQQDQTEDDQLPSGLLVYMNSTHPRYSYAETAEDGRTVKRTAEKNPISDKALIGAYGFRTGGIFAKAAHALCDLPIDPEKGRKEYYVSLVYNFLLADGRRVVALPRDEYESFGTPEELAEYEEKTKPQQRRNENKYNDM